MLGKSAAYISIRDFDKKFLYVFLQTDLINQYFMSSLTGTTIKNLGLKTIRETIIQTPSIREQSQIGAFFSNLDNLITLHQRKLTHLQTQKKALLQQMFV
jgi:type I restriction enzyme S subunit